MAAAPNKKMLPNSASRKPTTVMITSLPIQGISSLAFQCPSAKTLDLFGFLMYNPSRQERLDRGKMSIRLRILKLE
jgi:hypothetical protein